MPIIVRCPEETCGRQLRVPDDLLGSSVKCPRCGKVFTARDVPPLPEPDEEEGRYPSRRRSDAHRNWDEEDDFDEQPRRRRSVRRQYEPHRGTLILVFGILGLVTGLSFVFGPIAWVMGNHDLEEIRKGRMDPEGEGSTSAGRICGIIASIIGMIKVSFCVVCGLFYLMLFSAAAGSGAFR
jgi:hypothetical protein